MGPSDASSNTVRAVLRALDLLDVLAENPNGMTLTSLCEETNLNNSTAHRLLSTLVKRHYVRQDPLTKEYFLGVQTLYLGQTAQAHFDIRDEAIGPLRKLAAEVRELANIALLTDTQAVYIAQAPAEQRTVRMFTELGARVSLHCTGVGKAMMAFLPDDLVEHIVESRGLPEFTANTITNPLRLKEVLATVRENGYAVDDEEREVGVRCVAAPVFGATGNIAAAVSISGPSGRLTPDREHILSELVRQTAAEISRRLGYRPFAENVVPEQDTSE